MNSGTPKTYKKTHYTAKSAFSFVQLLAPNKQTNVIKAKVWARLTPIWAVVPLSHYIAWMVPLWVNIFLPSNTLARPSLIVQYCRQNVTETAILKFQFLAIIDFPFENDEFLTFQDSTNEFRDPENIQKDILHSKIRVFFRSVASPK